MEILMVDGCSGGLSVGSLRGEGKALTCNHELGLKPALPKTLQGICAVFPLIPIKSENLLAIEWFEEMEGKYE